MEICQTSDRKCWNIIIVIGPHGKLLGWGRGGGKVTTNMSTILDNTVSGVTQ